ncbi:ATP phosphoribosyltransferase regulatory subunit [Synechococcus sp. GFB01]|uniref:ATP phosphoribosyltransferase regulatory subunit n=1 Tax=Synechococcus sp. GFB01 TaxID=1662190 RepID=UPI000A592BAB|nr:ATP phosphoribosyltransferase regulatory subunit [Synechococcus sp. GFB01]
MALQPAAGARDLNPREVEHNRWICTQLAGVYRLWGYQEVAPPHFEHLSTLEAGGGIDGRELVRLAADEPLGLRPELTASIARAACTRLASRPRPLRLWAEGPTYRTQIADGGQQRIVEELQSGVELLGEASAAADAELLRLLLAASAAVGLGPAHRPRLLLGHHALLAGLLGQLPEAQQPAARAALTSFDPLALSQLPLPETERQRLSALMRLRGEPLRVLYQLEQWLGPLPPLTQLADTLALIAGAAERLGVVVQLDPTFQPHFALYDGLVLKLVCQGATAPLEVASGGRYDAWWVASGASLSRRASRRRAWASASTWQPCGSCWLPRSTAPAPPGPRSWPWPSRTCCAAPSMSWRPCTGPAGGGAAWQPAGEHGGGRAHRRRTRLQPRSLARSLSTAA